MKILSSEIAYQGKIFDIRVDQIRDGEVKYKREIIVHSGSCVILPVFDDGSVALVRQYRHAAGKYLLEACAGTLEEDEEPITGAARELEEEIGVTADKIEKLCEFYVSPGFLTEKMHLFMASGLREGKQNLDPDEILTIEKYSFPELQQMTRAGEIEDAKTIIGIMLASRLFRGNSA